MSEAKEIGAAASASGVGSFSSRLRVDLVAAQLSPSPEVQLALLATDSPHSFSPPAAQGDAPWLVPSPTSAQSSRPSTGLSLAALARAERALRKPVTLTNGGSHAAFTQEDIQRIRDPAVLQFMQENSNLFSRYLEEQTDKAERPEPSVPSPSPPDVTNASRMEADILNLQREIDTFITAVDEDGRSYQILTNEEGNVVVPVADTIEDSDEDARGTDDDQGSARCPESTGSAAAGSAPGRDDPDSELLQPVDLTAGHTRGDGRELDSAEPTPSHPVPAGSAPPREDRRAPKGPRRVLLPLSTKTPAATGQSKHFRRSGTKPVSLAAPAAPVRPVRALMPEEEERIEHLLREEGLNAQGPSPFAMGVEATRRMAEIDERLSALRVVRRAQRAPGTHAAEKEEGEEGGRGNSEDSSSSSSVVAKREHHPSATKTPPGTSARELGNTYMRQSAAAAQQRRELQRVNAELLRVQQELSELAEATDLSLECLPGDVLAMRPAWVTTPTELAQLPDGVSIADMLEDAAEEQRRCGVLGVGAQDSDMAARSAAVVDPYASLREALSAARERANNLLLRETEASPSSQQEPSSPPLPT